MAEDENNNVKVKAVPCNTEEILGSKNGITQIKLSLM